MHANHCCVPHSFHAMDTTEPPKHCILDAAMQVEALQHALATRHPNSLPAVLQAAKPPPAESRLVQQLQGEVDALQARLQASQREHEHSLRALQQQYEQLKAQAMRDRERERAEVGGERLHSGLTPCQHTCEWLG